MGVGSMKLALISFDLDGTLVDTASEIAEAANLTLDALALPRQDISDITKLIGHGTRELMVAVLKRAAASQTVDEVMPVFDRHYAETSGTLAKLYPGCMQTLDSLRGHGLRVACVTNKEMRHTRRVLEATGLASSFDLVVGGDSLPQKKPHASVLTHVAESFGLTVKQMAHVGDSSIDVQAARNAACLAWAVPWGYNGGKPVADSAPDRLFAALVEVAMHVQGLNSSNPARRR